jgi:hypothetical protein
MAQVEKDKINYPPKYPLLFGLDCISLAVFLIGLIWWIVWAWLKPDLLYMQIDGYTPYMLAAIAQSLAAVLALVFTISIIVAQISVRYSSRAFKVFFDSYTIIFFFMFVVAVLLPLWLLSNSIPGVIFVKCALVLSSVCLVLLIPYFIRFTKKLTPEYLLSQLTKEALNNLHAEPNIQPRNVDVIQGIVMSAFLLKDYPTCRHGIRSIALLAYEASKEASKSELSVYEQLIFPRVELYRKLEYIFNVTYGDPVLPFYVMGEICWNGYRAIGGNLFEEVNNIINLLTKLIYTAVHERLDVVASQAVAYINALNEDLRWKDLKSLDPHRFYSLRLIGIESAAKGLKDTSDQCISGLCKIGIKLIKTDEGGRLVKKIAAELSELYIGVRPFLPKGAGTICEGLIIMGTLSQISRHLDVRDAIISVLKTTIGTAAVKQQYLEMHNFPWPIRVHAIIVKKLEHKNFTIALRRFIEMVELP